MILAQLMERLRIFDAVAIFRHLSSEASFCDSCQILIEEESHNPVVGNWILSFINPAAWTSARLEIANASALELLEGSTDSDSESIEIVHELE